MVFRRALHLNPVIYSFFAGLVVSAAVNLLTSAVLGQGLPCSRGFLYLIAAMQLASGLLFFFVSVRLDELRGLQRSMATDLTAADLDVLLGDPRRTRPVVLALVGAVLGLGGSVIQLVTCTA